MIVKIGKHKVDVARRDCGSRECFQLGFDKGTFAQGRGYVSYHRDAKGRPRERSVCWTRHMYGCPMNSVCDQCSTLSVLEPGKTCNRAGCAGVLVAREVP